MASMFRWKKKESSDSIASNSVEAENHNKNLEELKSKFGELGTARVNPTNAQVNRSGTGTLLQDAVSSIRGTIAPLKGGGDGDDDGPSVRSRSKTDKHNSFADAISDLGNIAREAALRKEKHAAIERKRKLLDRLDKCRKMTKEANEIAEEVQAHIFFRVRLVSAIEDTPTPVKAVLPTPPPAPTASERPTFTKALSFANIRPSDTSSISTATPAQPRKLGKYVAASSFITRAANAANNHRIDDVAHRKLVEGTISQAEYNMIKQKMKEAGDMNGENGGGFYGGDSDDSDGENEAVNAEMESVLDSAVSHERMSVVAQCYCRLPRHEVLRSTGRVLGWGTGPAIITTSASWPMFGPVHSHFAPPSSCLPQPKPDDDDYDDDEEHDNFQLDEQAVAVTSTISEEGEEAFLELNRESSSSSLKRGSSFKRDSSSSALKRESSFRDSTTKRESSTRKLKPKKSISFGDAKELEETNPVKRKGVAFAVEEDSGASGEGDSKPKKKGVGFADPSSPPSSSSSTSSGKSSDDGAVAASSVLKRKSKERRRSIDLAPGAALEAARHDLMEMLGEAIKAVKTNEMRLKNLQKDTEGAPPHLATQIKSLMPLAERDTKTLDDLRAQSRAVSETIRHFSDQQKQMAADLLLQYGRKRVVETSNIDKEAMKLEAMNATQSILSKKQVDLDQELVLFEVECETMDDVLRSLQRFRFNVRRVVQKGNAAISSRIGGAAMAAASAAALAIANEAGVELGEKWEVEANAAELKQLLSLPSLTKDQRNRVEYLQSHTTDDSRRRSVAINATMAAAAAASSVSQMTSAASAAAAVAALAFGNGGDDGSDEEGDFDSRHRAIEAKKEKKNGEASSSGASSDVKAGDVTSSLRLLFRAVDTDGSGEIDAEELSAAMTELGLVDHDDQSANIGGRAITIFEAFDRDQSGSLEFDEFERLIRNRLHRNAIQPFVTHEAAYSALLRHLGIDIPSPSENEFESDDLKAASMLSSLSPNSAKSSSNQRPGMLSPSNSFNGNEGDPMSPLSIAKRFDMDMKEGGGGGSSMVASSAPRASLTRAIGAPPLPRTANTRARRIAHAANIGGGQADTAVLMKHRTPRRRSILSTPRGEDEDAFSAYAAVAAFPLAAANAAHLERDKDAAHQLSQRGNKRVSVIAPATLPRISSGSKMGGNKENRMMTDASAQVRLGHKSLKQRRYGTALEWFSLAASQGNAEGQFEVARMMDRGLGLETDGRDLVGAVSWYDAAARGGEARAMFKLAMLFRDGEGVEKDLELSEQWMKLAAESGIAAAQDNLASKMFRQAVVLPPKWREKLVAQAMEWLRRAAAQGLAHALLELGKRHMLGEDGVAKNCELSVKLFEQVCSAASVHPPQASMYELGGGDVFYDSSHARSSSMSDYAEYGIEPMEQGSNHESPNSSANNVLGGPHNDPWEGSSPYEASLTVAEAEYHLACCYRDGTGVGISETLSALWMERAADHGYGDAMFDLSFMIAHGYGCLTADPVVSVQWLRSADDIGHDKASRLLQKQKKLLFEENNGDDEDEEDSQSNQMNSLAHSTVSLSFQEKVKRRLSVVELAAALDEFVEEEEEEEEAALKQKQHSMKELTDVGNTLVENLNEDFGDDNSGDELEDGSGDEFDEIVTEDVQDRISESLSVGNNLGKASIDSNVALNNRFANIRASFLNPNAVPRKAQLLLGADDVSDFDVIHQGAERGHDINDSSEDPELIDSFSTSPPLNDNLSRISSGLNWNMGNDNSAIVGMGGSGSGNFGSVNPLRKAKSGDNADSKQAMVISNALVKLRLIESSLGEQQRSSQKWFDILASFEADRRDTVEKKFLGSGSNVSKLQGVNGGSFQNSHSASSNNLNSLKGLSMRYPVSRGGGGGGMSSGMGLLTLLGAEGNAGLSSLFSLLQAAESADVKAYDRLETLGDAWTQTSQSEISNSSSSIVFNNPSMKGVNDKVVGPSYARALAAALGELGYFMAEEARAAADAVAELVLPCESAKLSLQARSSEVMVDVNSAVQAAQGANTSVRVAWAGIADQHKLSNRRRHADVSRVRRAISLASSSTSVTGPNAVKQGEEITNLADNFKAHTPDGEGGGGCKWLALRNYRAAIKAEYVACEVAAISLKDSHAIAAELRTAASKVERDIVVLALQARIREMSAVAHKIQVLRLHYLEKMDLQEAQSESSSSFSTNSSAAAAASTSGDKVISGQAEKAAGVSAATSWGAADWNEERIAKESAGVRRILIPFVKDAILERARLLLSALDLDTNGDRASLSFFDVSASLGSGSFSSSSSSSFTGRSKRTNLLCGCYDRALMKAVSLIEAWGKNAEVLISDLPGVNGSAGDGGGNSSVMTSSMMMKRMSMGRRSQPTAATVPAEILKGLELCLSEAVAVFTEECDKIARGGEKKSSFIRPEDHAITSLKASSKDASEAATALKQAPTMVEDMEVSPTSVSSMIAKESGAKVTTDRGSITNSGSVGSNNMIRLKRSSAVWLTIQRRGDYGLDAEGNMDTFDDQMELKCGALVLTGDGFLHVFVSDDSLTNTFGSEISPPPISFLKKCLFLPSLEEKQITSSAVSADANTDHGSDQDVSIPTPALSIFMSADPSGRRTAVNKVKPGVFRLHISEPDMLITSNNNSSSTSIVSTPTHDNSQTLPLDKSSASKSGVSLSLPSALQPRKASASLKTSSTESSAETNSLKVDNKENKVIEGVVVAVDSDDLANDWIEDLLRSAIRKDFTAK